MSRYTTELRYLKDWTDEQIGLGDYPIFDENYRSTLNQKIRMYYYTSEIGFETPYLFSVMLKQKMNLIMPKYNELYKTIGLEINPFLTMDYTVKSDEKESTESDKSDESTENDKTNSSSNATKTLDTTVVNSRKDSTETSDSFLNADTGTVKRDYEEYDVRTTHNGGTTNTKSGNQEVKKNGSQTNTKTGSEQEKGKKGDVYEHGLSIDSTTPEGFVTTDSIEKDTWASGANKYRKRTESETDDNFTKTYQNVKDTTTFDNLSEQTQYNNVKDTFEYIDGSWDNVNNGKHGELETRDLRSEGRNFGSHELDSSGETLNTGTVKDDLSSMSIIDKVNNLLSHFEANQKKEGETSYRGFNGKTMSEMLKEYRECILNIDEMIIMDLKDMFIGVLN